jgi:hypothetical protein
LSLVLNFALILCLYFVNKHHDLYTKKLSVNYTATLEAELDIWFEEENLELLDTSSDELATRLNAAIQKQHCA